MLFMAGAAMLASVLHAILMKEEVDWHNKKRERQARYHAKKKQCVHDDIPPPQLSAWNHFYQTQHNQAQNGLPIREPCVTLSIKLTMLLRC